MEEKYIASIDLGSSKFGLCVARVIGDDVQIVYYRETPSDGIRASMITNPMKASERLKEAIAEAEKGKFTIRGEAALVEGTVK